MTAGRILGMERRETARFSLLMSIPVIIGAGLLGGIEIYEAGDIAENFTFLDQHSEMVDLYSFCGQYVHALVELARVHEDPKLPTFEHRREERDRTLAEIAGRIELLPRLLSAGSGAFDDGFDLWRHGVQRRTHVGAIEVRSCAGLRRRVRLAVGRVPHVVGPEGVIRPRRGPGSYRIAHACRLRPFLGRHERRTVLRGRLQGRPLRLGDPSIRKQIGRVGSEPRRGVHLHLIRVR